MKRIRWWQCIVPFLVLSVALTACGDEMAGGGGTQGATSAPTNSASPNNGAVACVDWVRFETPQDQFDQAGLVLIGKSVSRAGETSIYGHKAATHLVEVEQVLKGELGDGDLRISSMPPTCTVGGSYPEGDPLDPNQRVIIFANMQNGEWFTMTPAQGVLPFPQGAELPFSPR